MPPIRTTKKSSKRISRTEPQTAGSHRKSQAVLRGKPDASTGGPNMEEDRSPELAEPMESVALFDAAAPARDAVLGTPELLENILYFTGFTTLAGQQALQRQCGGLTTPAEGDV